MNLTDGYRLSLVGDDFTICIDCVESGCQQTICEALPTTIMADPAWLTDSLLAHTRAHRANPWKIHCTAEGCSIIAPCAACADEIAAAVAVPDYTDPGFEADEQATRYGETVYRVGRYLIGTPGIGDPRRRRYDTADTASKALAMWAADAQPAANADAS